MPLTKCGRWGKNTFASSLAAMNFHATRDLNAVPLRPYYDKGCRASHLTSSLVSRRTTRLAAT